MPRKMMDCSKMPSDKNCSLKITGSEDEVVQAAVDHAVASHGHKRSPELERQIRSSLRDEG